MKPILINGRLCNEDGTPFKFITVIEDTKRGIEVALDSVDELVEASDAIDADWRKDNVPR